MQMINGRSEIEEYFKFLRKNNSKDNSIKINKIRMYMNLLKKYGLILGEPYIKHLEGDLWELRPLRDRIIFAYVNNNKFVFLNIFIKKTQKTPRNEIIKAKKLLKNYIEGIDSDGKV